MLLTDVITALELSWDSKTGQDIDPDRGPASGQCCVSSLVLLTYFPGALVRCTVFDPDPIVHYFVMLDDIGVVDCTMSQFSADAEIGGEVEFDPPRELYWFDDTDIKYNLLLERVQSLVK